MKLLSIIIVSYYGLKMVEECIQSIMEFNDVGDSLEVIVSDNTPDGSVAENISKIYPQVKGVANCYNGGFGYGNNRGVEEASGRYLLFLNPDTILVEPIFKFAIDRFKSDKTLALFGLKLITRDGMDNVSHMLLDGFSFFDYWRQKRFWKKDWFTANIMFTSGADIFIRKDVFLAAGKFDENLFMYFEESDLLKRVLKMNPNFRNGYFQNKKIIHLEGGTKGNNQERALAAQKREVDSLVYYCKKYDMDLHEVLRKILFKIRVQTIKYKIFNQIEKYNFEKEIYTLYYDVYKKR